VTELPGPIPGAASGPTAGPIPGPAAGHREVHANGTRLHVVEAGSGPMVLLVHGFPMYWWTWRHTISQLAANGFRAVAVDLRGYGGSDRPPRGYDAPTLAADLAGVIRSLGEPGAALVGHGTGGLLAWTTAALIPQVVHRLVVVDAPHPVRMRHAMLTDRAQFAALRYLVGFQRPWIPERQLVANNAAWVDRFFHEWSGTPDWPTPEVSDRFRQEFQIKHTSHCALEFDRWAFRSLPRPDGRRFVRAMRASPITAPVLQIHGALDRNILPRSARGSEQFVAAPYAWRPIGGAGHFPHEEQPTTFNELLLAWLKSTPPWSDGTRELSAGTSSG